MLVALVAVTLIAPALSVSVCSAQDGKKKARAAKRRGGQQNNLFSPNAVRAVPGLRALVQLSGEQKAKLAEATKSALNSDEYKAALKTSKDKNADKKARRQAAKLVRETQSGLRAKVVGVLSDDQKKLVTSVNSAADGAAKKVRAEFAGKLKELKGDKEGRKKLQKEIAGKVQAAVAASVTGVLSDEQKEVVAKAPKKRAGKGGKKGGTKKRNRKKKDKGGDRAS